MKENYMAEKAFREIDKQVQQELARDPVAKKEWLKRKREKEYAKEVDRQVRKEIRKEKYKE